MHVISWIWKCHICRSMDIAQQITFVISLGIYVCGQEEHCGRNKPTIVHCPLTYTPTLWHLSLHNMNQQNYKNGFKE